MHKDRFHNKDLRKRYPTYKKQFKDMNKTLHIIQQQLTEQQQQLAAQQQLLATQQEILNLYYGEYQALKKRLGKAPLMEHIRMRDSMIKDMAKYEEQRQTNTTGYKLLAMYVNELTEILEDQSVEILSANPGSRFDPETQKPIKRVKVFRQEEDSLIYRVYNCGYRWNGIMLKKMDVCVCVR